MGLGSWRHGAGLLNKSSVLFLLVLLISASVPALASVYQNDYGGLTGTVTSPSVSLVTGSAGVSAVSNVAPDAATSTITSGLQYFESSNAATATISKDGSGTGDSLAIATSTPGTTTASTGTATDLQRNDFYCLGRYWIFYSDGTNEVWRTSTDGSTWGAATAVRVATSGGLFATWVDCSNSKVYYSYILAGGNIFERRGTLASGGTIAWDYTERSFSATENNPQDPAVALDTSGNEFIAFNTDHGGSPTLRGNYIEVWECAGASSSSGTCTWTNTDLVKADSYSSAVEGLYPILLPLSSGDLALVFNSGGSGAASAPMEIQTFSGSAWSTGVMTTSSYNKQEYSATAVGASIYFAGVASTGNVISWSCAYPCSSAPAETTISTATNNNAVISTNGANELAVAFGAAGGSSTISYVLSDNLGATWSTQSTLASSESINSAAVLSASYASGSNAYQFTWTSAGSSPYNVRFAYLLTKSTVSASLTTSNANDLVYVTVTIANGGSQTVTAVTDTAGLTYQSRGSATDGTTMRVETWYAIAPTTLTGDTVTATISSTAHAVMIVTGVSGVNTASPFDPSLSSPTTATGAGTTATVSLTTTFPNDYLIGAVGVAQIPTLTPGSGFSTVASLSVGTDDQGAVEGEVTTSVQSSSSVSLSWTGSSQSWAIIADALVAGKPSVTVDAGLSTPGSSGSTSLSAGSSLFLWTPAYVSGGSFPSGSWLLDLWAAGATAGTLTVSLWVVTSAGAISAQVLSTASTGSIGTSKTEVKTSLSGGAVSVPNGGSVLLVMTATSGGPTSFTIYWGAGQTTNYQTPAASDYILAISNPTSVSMSVNLAVASSSGLSRLDNMTAILKVPDSGTYSIYSKQLIVTAGTLSLSTGPIVTLAASTTVYVYVYSLANSMAQSTFVISLTLKPGGQTAYSMYTIDLTIN